MTCSPSLYCASKRPPLLSHIFHWKFKRYSMLPIASHSCFFGGFFGPCLRSMLLLIYLKRRNGSYLGAGDKWRFGLATWQSPGLTMALLIYQKFQFDDRGRNIGKWNPRTQDIVKIISHLMKKYNSCGMLKQLVASLRGMLCGPIY